MSLFLPHWAAIQRLEETVFYDEPLVLQKALPRDYAAALVSEFPGPLVPTH